MVKRLVVAVVGLVGVVVIALGVASATLWRADDVLVAELRAGEPLVVTDPGVLELAADEVTVRAEADGPVVLAIGRDTDVAGWVGEDPHERVTGLSGWHALAAEEVAAPTPTATAPADDEAPADGGSGEAPADGGSAAEGDQVADGEASEDGEAAAGQDAAPTVPDPSGSDLWVAEQRGDGEAQITWTAQPGRWSVLAASTQGTPLRVSLAWPQVVTTPWLWPGVVVGSLLVLLSAALLLRDVVRARRGKDAGWTPVGTGPVPVVDGSGTPVGLTRRQLRELAAHHAAGAGVRAPHDARPGGAPPIEHGQPVPVGAAGTVGAASQPPADEPQDVPAAPGGVRGAFASVAPATRRALRSVTSRGAAGDAQTPDAPAADVPATAAPVGPERADRPAWRPTPPPATPTPGAVSPERPSRDDAPTTAVPAASAGWTPAGAGGAPTSAVPAPTGRPGGSPRWSVGSGASPWTSGHPSDSAPSTVPAVPAASAPAGPGNPAGGGGRPSPAHGRPAWLGPATGATPAVPGASHRLPPPGAPGSPDAPRRPDAGPVPSAPGGGRAVPRAAAGAPAPRPGGSAPPAPGAPTGRATGPDVPRRPDAPRPSGAASPVAGAPVPSPDAATPATPRPAWLRDAPVPTGPRSGSSPEQGGGSRADAWRRAWGLPPTDDDTGSQEER
ncbi:conserved hypothetical protein [Cellulomonas flavigena DSM 20109]|uniref:Uncharacterized protein n=1 Tax=Cellulomonas flavigena (strain ATCC 482 / DSM 20109 / BCRC 11376 / JCM 18109 / NBRC 3775 / NCIMB 8073 / NRS 134) TaxID=446466 RepID=D5ULF2_CELFN|nr:hypothetical protein [Cellulomonas flavigena]ADG73994.1 conserved hypothetical protein [Cellulomonas flavigena DSM 20109]